MDFWFQLGFNVALQVAQSRVDAKKYAPVLAKIWVKIALMGKIIPELAAEMERQRQKEFLE